jgi:hypothetical protein
VMAHPSSTTISIIRDCFASTSKETSYENTIKAKV